MPQAFNWPAVRLTGRVLLRQPSLALPHVEVSTIADLNFKALRALGCRGVVFDKDNTLTAPYADGVEPSLAAALDDARDAFDGRLAVLSNSAGTHDAHPKPQPQPQPSTLTPPCFTPRQVRPTILAVWRPIASSVPSACRCCAAP